MPDGHWDHCGRCVHRAVERSRIHDVEGASSEGGRYEENTAHVVQCHGYEGGVACDPRTGGCEFDLAVRADDDLPHDDLVGGADRVELHQVGEEGHEHAVIGRLDVCGGSGGGYVPYIGVYALPQFQEKRNVCGDVQGLQIHDGSSVDAEVETVEVAVVDLLQC